MINSTQIRFQRKCWKYKRKSIWKKMTENSFLVDDLTEVHKGPTTPWLCCLRTEFDPQTVTYVNWMESQSQLEGRACAGTTIGHGSRFNWINSIFTRKNIPNKSFLWSPSASTCVIWLDLLISILWMELLCQTTSTATVKLDPSCSLSHIRAQKCFWHSAKTTESSQPNLTALFPYFQPVLSPPVFPRSDPQVYVAALSVQERMHYCQSGHACMWGLHCFHVFLYPFIKKVSSRLVQHWSISGPAGQRPEHNSESTCSDFPWSLDLLLRPPLCEANSFCSFISNFLMHFMPK